MWQEHHGYHVYKQQHGESCGPSSVLMLMRLIDNTITAEAMVRLWFAQAEAAAAKAGTTVYGSKPGDDSRIFDFTGGAGFDVIVDVVKKKRPAYNASTATDLTSKPGILRVGWDGNGGGHFIVFIGDNDPNYRWYLDPWYGMVYNPKSLFPRYDTTSGTFGAGVGTGTFTHLMNTA